MSYSGSAKGEQVHHFPRPASATSSSFRPARTAAGPVPGERREPCGAHRLLVEFRAVTGSAPSERAPSSTTARQAQRPGASGSPPERSHPERTRWCCGRAARPRHCRGQHTRTGTLTVTDGPRASLEAACRVEGRPPRRTSDRVRWRWSAGALCGACPRRSIAHRRTPGRPTCTRVDDEGRISRADRARRSSALLLRKPGGVARQAGKRTVTASIPSGKKLACECSGPGCKFAEFVGEGDGRGRLRFAAFA